MAAMKASTGAAWLTRSRNLQHPAAGTAAAAGSAADGAAGRSKKRNVEQARLVARAHVSAFISPPRRSRRRTAVAQARWFRDSPRERDSSWRLISSPPATRTAVAAAVATIRATRVSVAIRATKKAEPVILGERCETVGIWSSCKACKTMNAARRHPPRPPRLRRRAMKRSRTRLHCLLKVCFVSFFSLLIDHRLLRIALCPLISAPLRAAHYLSFHFCSENDPQRSAQWRRKN